MIAETIPEIAALDPSQKLLLAGELWVAAMASNLQIPGTQNLLAELERREREYRNNPSAVTFLRLVLCDGQGGSALVQQLPQGRGLE